MRIVELDITQATGRSVQMLEVPDRTTLSQLSTMARRLAIKSGWQRVRVGISNCWSTELLTNRKGVRNESH